MFKNTKFWLGFQAIALTAGNYVGWSAIVKEVDYFCNLEGQGLQSLTSFRGTFTTNPLLTPCFWGSIVFAIALIWTMIILFNKNKKQAAMSHKKLTWLLAGGTIFAALNNVPIFYKFITQPGAEVGCTVDKVTSPFATSCFYGLVAFGLSLIFALVAKKAFDNRLNSRHKNINTVSDVKSNKR